MRLLFCTTYPHLPDITGGLQTATDELCLALSDRGIGPLVLCGSPKDTPAADAVRPSDTYGYKIIRAADPIAALPIVAAAFEPTVIIVQSGHTLMPMLKASVETGYPTAIYIHNVELNQIAGTLIRHPSLLYIANSAFTAERLRALSGIEAIVLPPFIMPQRYIAPQTGDRVLFVNPAQIKGIEITLRLIEAHPDIPFTIVESWTIQDAWRNYLLDRCRNFRNLEWLPPTRSMVDLFSRSRLLLMPSLWEEAFGRTVIEAQLNGLPVLASNRGALPDTVGDGGIIVDAHAPIEDWVHLLGTLYHDHHSWQVLSDRARANSRAMILSTAAALDETLTRLAIHQPPELD